MPAPPPSIIAETKRKNEQVKKENGAAVNIQSRLRQKQAKFEVENKKQRKAEDTAATRIQAIKRGKQVRKEVALRSDEAGQHQDDGEEEAAAEEEVYADEAPGAWQKCTKGLFGLYHAVLSRCPCALSKRSELNEQMLPHLMPKHSDTQLSVGLEAKLRELFGKMDKDNDKILSKAEAVEFWGKNFAKINAQAMFNEVDDDHNETISIQEWLEFWRNVVGQACYSEEDILEEVESMLKGGSWVDWQDGRTT